MDRSAHARLKYAKVGNIGPTPTPLRNDQEHQMPKHDFLLLPETDGNYADYMQHFNSPDAVKVDDNILVRTILDTLSWIPTINPANPEEWQGYGLNYYGPTVINKAGAAKASRIFHLWAELLEEGPEELELTGSYEWNEGEDLLNGAIRKIHCSAGHRRDGLPDHRWIC